MGRLTLALLKPDVCSNKTILAEVYQRLKNEEFKVLEDIEVVWSLNDAESFYGDHKGKFFYPRLCQYMARALVLEKENAISEWRKLIGPTRPYEARFKAPDSLRALYGISDTRNSFHGTGTPILTRFN